MSLELPKCSPFDSDNIVRVVGIDPGVNSSLGISIYEKDVESNEKALVWATTVGSKSFTKIFSDVATDSGERFARLHGYKCFLVDLFHNWQPDYIVCEGNYLGKFASAYGALTEIVLIIRIAAMDYRSDMPVEIIQPSVIKKCIGVSGNTGDKELIKEAIVDLGVLFHQPQDIDKLDKHAIDAIAIGYCGLMQLEDESVN